MQTYVILVSANPPSHMNTYSNSYPIESCHILKRKQFIYVLRYNSAERQNIPVSLSSLLAEAAGGSLSSKNFDKMKQNEIGLTVDYIKKKLGRGIRRKRSRMNSITLFHAAVQLYKIALSLNKESKHSAMIMTKR